MFAPGRDHFIFMNVHINTAFVSYERQNVMFILQCNMYGDDIEDTEFCIEAST